jgi:amidophosphoribosyltransferase
MCGIFGIMSKTSIGDAIHQGMSRLQHRGQHAAGIFTYDPRGNDHFLKRNLGLVNDVFNTHNPALEDALWGIGHIRYSTVGNGCLEDTQPQLTQHGKHFIAMAHNGNVVNYLPLKQELQRKLVVIETTCDLEVILHTFAQNLPQGDFNFEDICRAVEEVYKHTSGAYSVVGIITDKGMIAFRDPQGIRPLLYGIQHETHSHAFASETEALSFLNFSDIQIINPGEVIFIDQNHKVYRRQLIEKRHFHCSFEFVYFAKTNTVMEGQAIYKIRSDLGVALARHIREADLKPDIVVAVPESARPAAIGLARALDIPFEEGLIRKEHMGRTFTMSTQTAREKANSHKLEAVPFVFKDRKVLLVDDSIVRGTVSKHVVQLARKAGAKKIYFCSTFPPINHPCFYGIDFPHRNQLIAHEKNLKEIATEIGADEVIYNELSDLKQAIGIDDLCDACLTGDYPIKNHGVEELQALRFKDLANMEILCPK